ncbi:MAG: bifunctional phosphopantothenoylcysteine decarboxylase/phosphopantothenate--cysteine ligase CoaBC [Chloroflexota bacterium]|nr:MAG: bifunctional phosphopantothenoylcysteine decarboxylase/phosphopantothenate--cysteine ligase CoaBC [Chloroflexota bacterium]
MTLAGKNVVLGVTGSIAAFKAVALASELVRARTLVDVIMTASARQFVAPLSFQAVTHRSIFGDVFAANSELNIEHVELAERADIVVIAPATANTIAKLAAGMADDVLGCTVLATDAPILLAPAMDAHMFDNPATQENVARLRARGWEVVGPAAGRLASGLVGVGRLVEVEELMGAIRALLGRSGDLAGRSVVVTAGGTQEPIDPVRYISNRSSGKMGYAVAEAARDRGAQVTLISTPTALPAPFGVQVVYVNTAEQMLAAVRDAVQEADALIMAAAVADYRPARPSAEKIKKADADVWQLELVKNPDILAQVRGDFVRVGFAAESQHLLENALAKLHAKQLDLIVANDISTPGSGFAVDDNQAVLLDAQGERLALPLMAKRELADQILNKVIKLLGQRRAK